jgi:hypothetical protein
MIALPCDLEFLLGRSWSTPPAPARDGTVSPLVPCPVGPEAMTRGCRYAFEGAAMLFA